MSATLYYRKGVSNLAFGDFILSVGFCSPFFFFLFFFFLSINKSVGIVTCSLGDRAGQVAESNGRQVLNRVHGPISLGYVRLAGTVYLRPAYLQTYGYRNPLPQIPGTDICLYHLPQVPPGT